MATNPDLPEAILLEIFSRLPTKSVARCRCLSKSWRRELSTTHFINKHLVTRQQTTQQQNLALITFRNELYIVTSPLKNDEKVKIWTGVPERWETPLGACNGLVLLFPYEKDDGLSVMNPITLQQVNVPYPNPPWDNLSDVSESAENNLSDVSDYNENDLPECYASVYGFGYDCYTDDFKVITLQFSYPVEINSEVPKSVTLVDVYSLKRGVWKRLDTNIYPYGGDLIPSLTLRRNGAFVNGSLHWFICKRKSGVYCHIAAFDLAKEVFHNIPIPADFDRNPVPFRHDLSGIAVIGGCLSIVRNIGGSDPFDSSSGGGSDVWMMKEYGVAESWVRFHIAGHAYGFSLVPLCMVGDEQLMCYTETYDLVASDLKDGTTKKVSVGGKDTWYRDGIVMVGGKDTWYRGGIAFVDSLVSPGKCDCDN